MAYGDLDWIVGSIWQIAYEVRRTSVSGGSAAKSVSPMPLGYRRAPVFRPPQQAVLAVMSTLGRKTSSIRSRRRAHHSSEVIRAGTSIDQAAEEDAHTQGDAQSFDAHREHARHRILSRDGTG